MKKLFSLSLIFFVIALFLISGNCSENQAKSRSIFLHNSLIITGIPANAKKIEIWLPLPQKTSYQSISDLKISTSLLWKINKENEYGNRFVHLSGISPAQKIQISYSFKVVRKEERTSFSSSKAIPVSLDSRNRRLSLGENHYVKINGKIRRLAEETTFGAKTDMEKARAIYNYVLNHMVYDKTTAGWGKGDSVRACEIGRGNCTDFHSFFLAMARSKGLPAGFEIGYLVPQNKNGLISGYHCWARVFLSSYGWVPVDISEAWKDRTKEDYYFGSLTKNHIILSKGRDLNLGQKGVRLNFFVEPYIEVDGVPLNNFKFTVEYGDITLTNAISSAKLIKIKKS